MVRVPLAPVSAIQVFREEVWHVVHRLHQAHRFAIDCGCNRAEFGVSLQELYEMGLRHEELQWLMRKKLVEQRECQRETLQNDELNGVQSQPRPCFVLADQGVELFENEWFNDSLAILQPVSGESAIEEFQPPMPTPVWDTERHELKLKGRIVKKFKWRAANQEAILAAFQEDGWPAHIDDPLPQEPEIDPKRRLADAIKSLNRHQQLPMIRFCGDGTGEGVLWEFKQ